MHLPGTIYRFGQVEFDPSNLKLTVAGEKRALEPKSYRLLAYLIEKRGQAVRKEDILRVVWQDAAVTDNALTRAVAQIRKALDDDAKESRFLETVPTVGYRFVAELKQDPALATAETPAVKRKLRLAPWPLLAMLVAVAGAAVWSLKWNLPLSTPRPIPLTSYRGTEDIPSFSPDGNAVAFHWNGEREDNWDIYVKGLGADSTPIRLTTNPAPDVVPAWSPDGRRIAFLRRTAGDRFALMLVPALGGPERKLAEFSFRTRFDGFNPAWSADNQWVVVPGVVGDGAHLFRVSTETGEVEQIVDAGPTFWDQWPSISPDGKTLLFTRRTTPTYRGDLYRVRIDRSLRPTEQPRKIPTGPEKFSLAAWMADGKELLAFGAAGIHRLPAEGSENPKPIPWLNSSVNWLDVSRRGNRLAYSVQRGDANVWRQELGPDGLVSKGSRPERLIASAFRDVYPQYSPDGRQIAFYSNRDGSTQTWIANADGLGTRQLTFVKTGSAGTPVWSPDGKTLALNWNPTGVSQIYTISADGGRLNQLTGGPSANFAATWSRDGRWLYFASNRSGRNEVWRMPSGGGPAIQLTQNGGVKAIESADGRTLYFSKESGAGSIWSMPAAGGPEEQLAASLYRFNFAVVNAGIYYMAFQQDDATTSLRFYSFKNKSTTLLMPMGQPEYGLDVSPDGRYLTYAQLDDPGSILMLVENFH